MMKNHTHSRKCYVLVIIFILGAVITFISINQVKSYGGKTLLITMVGILIMLSAGWSLEKFKKK
ncbi:hypothetical protein COE58_24335 [Bacillus cereus]|nr:hypothetical protein COE58_24335 [Bacillus cereus]